MGLTREDELDRTVVVGQQRFELGPVMQEQVGPFVGGEPSCEPDGQHVRVEIDARAGGDEVGEDQRALAAELADRVIGK